MDKQKKQEKKKEIERIKKAMQRFRKVPGDVDDFIFFMEQTNDDDCENQHTQK